MTRRGLPGPLGALCGAGLPGARLSGAFLPGAFLPGALLSGALLPGALLPGALLPGALLSGAFLPGAAFAGAALPGLDGGHLKGRWQSSHFPGGSVFREAAGAVSHDQAAGLRLKFSAGSAGLSFNADYQLYGQHGDSLAIARELAGLPLSPPGVIDDDRRWWDLSAEIASGSDSVLVHRLDRLHLNWSGEKTVLRFGRQAVSWGNGLIFNPMDFFNPFDPAAVDTEYKVGDDMLYGQYLLDSGDDWQVVNVQRRDAGGERSAGVSSTAFKYHGFGLDREYDLLLAEHYDQVLAGAGGVVNLGESVLRGDLLLADGEAQWVASAVLNWSYSWVWGGRNVSGVAEYFFNGFGLRQTEYSPEQLAAAVDLVARLRRGELYTLGRHYLGVSLQLEWTPLLNLSPNLLFNLGDQSALSQLVLQWDLAQDWQLLAALNLPLGPVGTEYGGLELGREDLNLAAGPSLFAQLAYYF